VKLEGELPAGIAEDNILVKKLLCTAALLFGATALRADVFSFSYAGTTLSGSPVSATGTVIATAVPTATAIGTVLGSLYTITNIYGTRNGVSISAPTGAIGSFIFSGSSSSGTLNFLVNKQSDAVAFTGGVYSEAGLSPLTVSVGKNFSISRVPEAATLSLLFTMGLGVWLLARKLPSKKLL
jgi:hypothetical protein